MNDHHTFSAVTSQFALACCLVTVTFLVTLGNGITSYYYPLVLLGYAPLVYGANRIFLRQERTMRGLVLLNLFFWVGIFASVCWSKNFGPPEELVFAGIFCLWVTIQGNQMAVKAPNLHHLILHLDASALILVLFMGYLSVTGAHVVYGIPIVTGFAASILGMVADRIDRPLGGREWGMVAGAFLLISLLVWLLVSVVAEPAGQGVVALWNGAVAAVIFLLRLLWQVLVFLASLFPEPEQGELEMEPMAGLPEMAEGTGEENPVVLAVLLAAAAVLAAVLLIWLLRRLGQLRVGGITKTKRSRKGEKRRLSLWQALGKMIAAWRDRLRQRRFLWRNRNRPLGLYYNLVHRCRIGPWRKQVGETPREFLTRLRMCAKSDPEMEAALLYLVEEVDRALYSPHYKGGAVPSAKRLRRGIGWAVSRQFVCDSIAQARETMHRKQKGKTVAAGS